MAANDTHHVPSLIDATLNGAGTTKVILPVSGCKTLGLQEVANVGSGNLAATLVVSISGNYKDPENGKQSDIDREEAAADWNVIASGLANPAGVALDSQVTLTLAAKAIRFVYTYTSGAGRVALHATKMSN